MNIETLLSLLDLLHHYHDPYCNSHSSNTMKLVKGLAEAHGYDDRRMESLVVAAQLHDVGKLLIPDSILKKQTRLTRLEMSTIRRHVEIGYEIASKLNLSLAATAAIYEHHERWDGTGYPRGLRGEAISVEGRILAICDTFDALTSKRAYRDALDVSDAKDIMQNGHLFDPQLLQLFFEKVIRL